MTEFEPMSATAVRRILRDSEANGLDEVGCAWSILAAQDRIIVAQLCALLPGSYYMDPPDGGSVTVLEQLRRMAEDARKWREHQQHIERTTACEIACEGGSLLRPVVKAEPPSKEAILRGAAIMRGIKEPPTRRQQFDPWQADKDAQMNPATDGDPGIF